MKEHLEIINQLYSLEQKITEKGQGEFYGRYLARMTEAFKKIGYTYVVPVKEKYSETRTDFQATIVGEPGKNMIVKQVIKPIIFYNDHLVQQGIVIVEKSNNEHD